MAYMIVTLDVSRLSGWLNADAYCRVEREASEVGRQAGRKMGGRGIAAAAQAARRGGPNCGGCCQGTRGAHLKHVLHGCDAGGVEAQRLIEGRRVLPSRKRRIGRGATCTCGPGGGSVWRSGGSAKSVQGGTNCGSCWQGTRRAHVKHVRHACDAGGVEAQRLVEARRPLPSRKGSIRRGATGGRRDGRA